MNLHDAPPRTLRLLERPAPRPQPLRLPPEPPVGLAAWCRKAVERFRAWGDAPVHRREGG